MLQFKGETLTSNEVKQIAELASTKKKLNEVNSLKKNTLWVHSYDLLFKTVQQMILFSMQVATCSTRNSYYSPCSYAILVQEFVNSYYFNLLDSPGSGNWSDMTIEQVLMRDMKTQSRADK